MNKETTKLSHSKLKLRRLTHRSCMKCSSVAETYAEDYSCWNCGEKEFYFPCNEIYDSYVSSIKRASESKDR